MPLRNDIKKVLVIGSGPIVIGQAAEFDYAGTQACRALKQEGLEVVLINSNPATIMTDKAMADKVYIEPLTLDVVKRIIEIEKPDSVLLHPRRTDRTYAFNAAWPQRDSLNRITSSFSEQIPKLFIKLRTDRLLKILWKK